VVWSIAPSLCINLPLVGPQRLSSKRVPLGEGWTLHLAKMAHSSLLPTGMHRFNPLLCSQPISVSTLYCLHSALKMEATWPLKCWYCNTSLHTVMTQRTTTWIFITMTTSSLASSYCYAVNSAHHRDLNHDDYFLNVWHLILNRILSASLTMYSKMSFAFSDNCISINCTSHSPKNENCSGKFIKVHP
jgi:hypothetical protein